MTTQEVLDEADQKMRDAVAHTSNEFAKVRTGRANPGLVSNLPVEYYGTKTPLQQLAGVSVPEARVLLITPYDPSALKEIERAITVAELGVNPSNDGSVIRVVFPDLTEERRKDYVRTAKQRAEEGRVSVRSARRQARNDLSALASNGDISEDEEHRAEGQLQKLTDRHVEEIDRMLSNKESELTEV